MKNTKICPKCGSREILRVKDGGGDYTNALLLGFLSMVYVPRYVCCDCGYVEEWVDSSDLRTLKEKLKKQREKENM
jgi:uncharacterized OB-fold protein